MPDVRTVILLRHGEADTPAPDAFLGRTDTALTENGRLAAQNAAKRLSRMRLDAIVTSPLVRCVQTARLLRLPPEIKTEPALAERDFGDWNGKSRASCRADEAAWAQFALPDGAPPNGESVSAFHERVAEAYERVLDETEGAPAILIVAHHSVLCSIASHALGLGAAGAYRFACAPGSLSAIDYVDGFAQLTRWNA